ncbi:MAG: MgPME-cyclase complex family protein [Synechococcus sp.]|nr:MgPME-cyclase complex family protein [Synechococcus sp.]
MSTYFFVAASERFLTEEEPLEEVLRERARDYQEKGKEIDFWLVRQPAFLDAPDVKAAAGAVPRPAAAVVSTDATFIDFMKLRLEFVLKGSFSAPSASVPDPLASL